MRAIFLSLFLFACNDYVDTFWSKDEQVNMCLPLVKYYWGTRGETIYLNESGAEILVVEDADCVSATSSACINDERVDIQIDSWIFDESERYCDVIAHEIGHFIGYQHKSHGLMSRNFPLGEKPIILPVSRDRPSVE